MTDDAHGGTRYFDDISVGETARHGPYEVTESEIVEFAKRYDPQPIHTDPVAAADSEFDGLIASGFHTAAICMRLLVDGPVGDRASTGGIGVDELRWHAPVRPGDRLWIDVEVVDVSPSTSKTDRGVVSSAMRGINQDDETVISWTGFGLVATRQAD